MPGSTTVPAVVLLRLVSSALLGAPTPAIAAAHNISYLSASRFPLEAVGMVSSTIEVCTTPPLPAASGTKLFVSLGQPGNAITFPGFRVGGQAVGGSVLPIKPNGTAGWYALHHRRLLLLLPPLRRRLLSSCGGCGYRNPH